MTLVITLIKPISLSICINFQYFYMQKTAKITGAPPLTRDCVEVVGRPSQTWRAAFPPRVNTDLVKLINAVAEELSIK